MPNNLSLEEAIEALELESQTLEIPTLDGIDPTTIYELGFATAVKHLKDITGPSQMEVSIITVDVTAAMIAEWDKNHPDTPYQFDADATEIPVTPVQLPSAEVTEK